MSWVVYVAFSTGVMTVIRGAVVSTSAINETTELFSFPEVSRAPTSREWDPLVRGGRNMSGTNVTFAPPSRAYHHVATSLSGLETVRGTLAAG